jgi:hypothetical protein
MNDGNYNRKDIMESIGKLGKAGIRKWNVKRAIYHRPEHINLYKSDAAVASQDRVKPMSHFPFQVCSITELKPIWDANDSLKVLSAYHKNIFSLYRKVILYLTLILYDKDGNVKR